MTENNDSQLKRELSSRHIGMIALGGTIGTGLFLGAGNSIKTAGPSIVLVYAIVGLFMFWMMRALGEMLLSDHSQTTFVGFVEKYLGKKAGFVIGWTYWIGWIVIAMAELTAIGKYMSYWPSPIIQAIPVWAWELIFLVVLLLANVITVKAFGEFEYWFSMIKVVAILAIIFTGIVLVSTGFKNASLANMWKFGFFANNGSGFLIAFQMAFFAFTGIEFVGITAAEAKDPDINIPKAVNSIILRIMIFYLGALVAIMSIYPWTNYGSDSPFVQVFSGIGITSAALIVNFVVLTAAASALNSSIFTTGRMLFSNNEGKNNFFSKLSKRHIPLNSILFSAVLIGLAALVNFIFPKDAFELITSVATATFIFIYGVLVFAHLKYRQSSDYKNGRKLFKMPGAPVTNWLTLIFFVFIFLVLLTNKTTLWPALISIFWMVLMSGISFLVVKD
ncbi:MAG: amino acid permease [Lactobacillaceae bacterium]|jgi:L-asparagine transporter-like permease|nr:amino acid permease [Lactobacillaceae bacterium]